MTLDKLPIGGSGKILSVNGEGDLRRRFLDTNRFEEMICEDGIHPNELGQREIFEAVKQSVGRPACRNAFFSS